MLAWLQLVLTAESLFGNLTTWMRIKGGTEVPDGTFWPRKRLLADRMVKPSPGPSSTVEFGTASLSLSVFFESKQKWCSIKT